MTGIWARIKDVVLRQQRELECDLNRMREKREELISKTHDLGRRAHVIEFETYGQRRDQESEG